jgi:hypothetical protein
MQAIWVSPLPHSPQEKGLPENPGRPLNSFILP